MAVISVFVCPANFPRFSDCVANTIHIFEGEGWNRFEMDNDVNVLRTRDCETNHKRTGELTVCFSLNSLTELLSYCHTSW